MISAANCNHRFEKSLGLETFHITNLKFLWKKEHFDSAGYRYQDLSIAGRMLDWNDLEKEFKKCQSHVTA